MTAQPALIDIQSSAPTVVEQAPYAWAEPWGWRTSKPARCRRCRARILRGFDDDWCAFQVDADPTPLTGLGEVLALMAGHRTLTARRNHHRLILTRRDRYAIATFPAQGHRPGNRWDVIPEHTCRTTWADAAITSSVITPPPPTEFKECPY